MSEQAADGFPVVELVVASPPVAGCPKPAPAEHLWPSAFPFGFLPAAIRFGFLPAIPARLLRLFLRLVVDVAKVVLPLLRRFARSAAARWRSLAVRRRRLAARSSGTDPSSRAASLLAAPGAPPRPSAA